MPATCSCPTGSRNPRLCLPGVLAIEGPAVSGERPTPAAAAMERFCAGFSTGGPDRIRFPLVVIVDDSEFTARTLNNFLWVTFTRSNPAADVYGIGASRGRSIGAAADRW